MPSHHDAIADAMREYGYQCTAREVAAVARELQAGAEEPTVLADNIALRGNIAQALKESATWLTDQVHQHREAIASHGGR